VAYNLHKESVYYVYAEGLIHREVQKKVLCFSCCCSYSWERMTVPVFGGSMVSQKLVFSK